jgi:uncharacterized protein DUF5916
MANPAFRSGRITLLLYLILLVAAPFCEFFLPCSVAYAGENDKTVFTVAPPAVADADITVDGRLDETIWSRAAVLRDFWQYLPNDDRAADDSTTILVWYSRTGIYFGIRAYQDSASVRATLADRDKISGDDYVEILLDTFDDRRQAFVFGVNPLGIEADGTLQDAARQTANITSSVVTGAYTIDLSPDFVYESKGRQTAWGYEVEMRIPFKTLRYKDSDPQDWGINVIRVVQATGHQHTWTRVLQTQASFLAQSGTLTGLTDLHRGLVLDVTPEVTSSVTGTPQPSGWHYGGGDPRVGATLRWGATANLALHGTVRPDFSQVEADVPQIQFDPSVALFFPEKRPFFLDGLELFQTPVRLIYTRRLVDPEAAATLTGKVGATTLAFLSGVDGTEASASGTDHPVMNALRLRQDLNGQNSLGLVYTDRVDGTGFNRVAAIDGLLTPGDAWSITFQGGGSATRDSTPAAVRWGPLWSLSAVRSGERFGLNFQSRGVGDDFRASSGFLSRAGVVSNSLIPSYTVIGAPGSFLESFTANAYLAATWIEYRHFSLGHAADNLQDDMSAGFTLRGGWQLGVGLSVETFGYPARLYPNFWVEQSRAGKPDTVPFTGQARIPNTDYGLNLQTPRFQSFSLTGFVLWGNDENFYEWASGRIIISTIDLTWRPTDQLRAELIYNHQQVNRRDDGSSVALIRVPQLRLEYQLSRPIFIRFIGEYNSSEVDALRDDSRTNGAILIRDPVTGVFTRSARSVTNSFRMDWLFSYRPTPGTVAFFGYGSSLDDGVAFGFRTLSRVTDGFFVKLSYLYRA